MASELSAQTYDARGDFNLAANPNGVWSYGTLTAVTGGAFTPFTLPASDKDYPGQLLWYTGGSYPDVAAVQANASGQGVTSSNTVLIPPDQLNIDGEDRTAAVRWTAPADGVYNVAGLFQRNDNQTNAGPVPVTVSIVQNGGAVLFQEPDFLTFQSQVPFDVASLPLLAGETLDFVESSDLPHNDSVGLSATITTAGALTAPIITVSATTPVTTSGGDPGVFTLNISTAPTSKLTVRYVVKGSAANGVDYEMLSGKAKIKPGHTTATIQIVAKASSDNPSTRKVKLVLQPGDGYVVGTLGATKVKVRED